MILALIACAGIGAYCLSDSEQTADSGNSVEFYPTDGTTLVLGTYMGNVPVGEHFSGWSLTVNPTLGQTPDYLAGGQIALTSDNSPLKLYAVFAYNIYNIAFDGNGSTDTMADMADVSYGSSVDLSACTMAYAGHTFDGWNTAADGSGTAYADGASVSDLTADDGATVTLYAQWTANGYTITYSAGAGTGEDVTQSVTYGESVTLSGAVYSMAHHTQTAWSDGYALNQTFDYDIAGDLDLTAVYTADSYGVTYDAGTHTTLNGSATAAYGSDLTISFDVDFSDNSADNDGIVVMKVYIGGSLYDTTTADGAGTYTVSGSDITGAVTVTTEDINCFSVTYCDGDGSNPVTCSYYTLDDSYTAPVLTYGAVHQRGQSHWGSGWRACTGYGQFPIGSGSPLYLIGDAVLYSMWE